MKKTAYITVSLLIGYVSCEILLRSLAPFFTPSLRAIIREEAYRGAQTALRVSRGAQIILRKSDFKKGADIVALGDSMAFGTLAKESETWPSLLAGRTGSDVLNLGVGSHGPAAYNYMLNVALANLPASPRFVIYTIFANDIGEEVSPPPSSYKDVFIWEDDYKNDIRLRIRTAREWVFQHSILYQLIKRAATFKSLVAGVNFKPVYYRDKDLEFAFTPVSYWQCLDLRNPNASSAFEGTIEKTLAGQKTAREAGARFIVVLMPFKEQVYVPLFIKRGSLAKDAYDDTYDSTYDKLLLRLEKVGVETLDLRPAFRQAAEHNLKLYWTLDGHLTPFGHELTAIVIARSLKR